MSRTPTFPLEPGPSGVLAARAGSGLAVDAGSLRREVQLFTAVPATGTVVPGVFGEGAVLDSAEQDRVVRTVADEAGRTPLVVALSARSMPVPVEQVLTVAAAGEPLAALTGDHLTTVHEGAAP